MSRVRFSETSAASIPTPSTGKASLFFDTDGAFKAKLDDGSVVTLTVSEEYIQDLIGNMIIDSPTIDVTYDDIGNTLSIAVIQSALDHGSIGGLGDDDHTQYHNDARGDARYYTKSQVDTLISNHEAALNPHPQYLTQAEGDAAYDVIGAAAAAQAYSIQRANHTGTQTASTISDFTEAAQDAVAGSLLNTSTVSFTYNDGANTLSADVDSSGLDPAVIPVTPFGNLVSTTLNAALYELQGDIDTLNNIPNVLRVKLSDPGPNDFTSVAAAVNSIVGASHANPYIVLVHAGVYIEPVINVPSYVSIVGLDEKSVVIKPDGNHHVFTIQNPWVYMSFFSIEDAPVGYSGVYCNDADSYSLLHKLHIANCDNGLTVTASTVDTYIYTEYCDIEECTTSVNVLGTTALAYSQNENLYVGNYSLSPTAEAITVHGNSQYIMQSGSIENIATPGTGSGLHMHDGASVRISNTNIVGWNEGVVVENTGASPNLELRNPIFTDNTTDFRVDHVSATGFFIGYSEYTKRSIDPSNSFFIANKDSNIITVAKKGGDFSSIKDAVDSITGSSSTNEFIVSVGPGVFTEAEITSKPYVNIIGSGENSTIIEVAANNHNAINVDIGNLISNLKIKNVGSGFSAINYSNKGDNTPTRPKSRLSNITIEDCDIGINVYCNNAAIDTHMHADFIDILGTYSYGVKIENDGGICACLDLVHYSTQSIAASTDLYITGPDADVMVHAATIDGSTTNTAFHIQNGAAADVSATIIKNSAEAIYIPNVGSAPDIKSSSVTFVDNTSDINILRPNTTGVLNVTASKSKIVIDSDLISTAILDPEATGFITNGPLYYSSQTFDTVQEIGQIIQHGPTMGIIDGGALSVSSGLTVAVSSGYGYHMKGPTEATEVLIKREWAGSTLLLPASTNSYVFINNNGILSHDTAYPDTEETILLGKVYTNATDILYIQKIALDAHHYGNKLDRIFREAIGPLYATGSIVVENGTRQLDVTSGEYYFSETEFLPAGGTAISFDTYYQSATPGVYTRTAGVTTVPKDFYDDGSGTLAAMPTGKHAKHLLMMLGGPSEKYALVYATAYYNSNAEAEAAALPNIPSFMDDAWVRVASIVVHEASTNIQSILDERPIISTAASASSGGITDHGALTGLGDDDHTQYLLINGTRAMTGDIDLGGNDVTNVGLVDGVDVSAHASRHLPNGADPLTTGVPSSIGTANSEGIANAFARQDHVHNHGNQTNASHHAVATTSANGFMSSTDKTKLDGIGGARKIKAGTITAGSFTGNPKKYTLTFGTAFDSANYSISIIGGDSRAWSIESQVAGSIVINSNSNTALTQSVLWTAIDHGETTE